ncbi:hypothetical protein [Paraburkholderia sp. RL17-347-BIC-D]|uniref:hypothetical protein n=1 Tax=Paraburkholderia sp. RL17-347-BIC-D TaxID=3031632 RepID=UPI0038BD634D
MAEWANPFFGVWRYRSFLSEPDAVSKLEEILFREAGLLLDDAAPGKLTGQIGDGTDSLDIRGYCVYGSLFDVRFQATGIPGAETDGWVYDYMGTSSAHYRTVSLSDPPSLVR